MSELNDQLSRRRDAAHRLPALEHLGYADPDCPPAKPHKWTVEELRYIWATSTPLQRKHIEMLATTAPHFKAVN